MKESMVVEIRQTSPSTAELEWGTDQISIEIALDSAHVEQLHARLASVLNDTTPSRADSDIMVERRPLGPRPVFMQLTRGDAAVPIYLTESEAETLVEDARQFLAAEAQQ